MELSRSNIKKFQEMETLTRFLIFLETEPFSPPQENFLYFRKWKHQNFSYIFSKENFSYISGNGNLKKISYIPGNGTSLCFGKGIFRTLAHLELEAYSEPWHIQNHEIFRTRGIFRTLSYINNGTFHKKIAA